MVIGIIRIVLSGIILCSEIIRCQIKKQACAAAIAVKAADDLVKKAFHHQFFDHDPCPDAQAAAPGISSLILRQFGVRKVSQKVWIRIHHFRIVFTFLTDRCAFGDVVFLVRLINPVILVIDVDDPFDRPFINLTLDLGYFDLEIVVHLDRLTLKIKSVYLLNNYTKDSPKNQ